MQMHPRMSGMGIKSYYKCDNEHNFTKEGVLVNVFGKPLKKESTKVNPIKYTIAGDTVTITGCDKKASGALIIPAVIEGKSVTRIRGYAFHNCNRLTGIMLPDSIKSIMEFAFSDCTRLTSITIPERVTSISHGAFKRCTRLTTIKVATGNVDYKIVNGVLLNTEKTVLHTYPAGKTGSSYTIPNSVARIEAHAFSECANLTSIMIPDSVTSIGSSAFRNCNSLTSITIPDSVTSIGLQTFYFCWHLTAVTFLGDAPKNNERLAFSKTPATIYRKPDAKGWGDTLGGRPVKLISEQPQEAEAE